MTGTALDFASIAVGGFMILLGIILYFSSGNEYEIWSSKLILLIGAAMVAIGLLGGALLAILIILLALVLAAIIETTKLFLAFIAKAFHRGK